ncbi:hypothetical protein BA895_08285 [Humibacillus sp. DSM 29435]|nr:hypothetical protein BA895_08285 [Humibacillus sp. DSM 29435]
MNKVRPTQPITQAADGTQPPSVSAPQPGPASEDGGLGGRHVARAARGGALNLAGALVSGLSAFALAAVVTNGHSKAEAGAFFTTTALFLLATNIGQLGTNTGVVYFISRARGTGSLRNAGVYMRLGMRPVLILGVALAVAMWVWAQPLAELMSNGPVDSAVASSIRWLAPFVPLAAVLNVSLSGTRGLGSMKANAILDQLLRPLLQLGLVAVAAWVISADQMPTFWAIPYLPAAVLAWWAWRKMSLRATGGAKPDPGYLPRRAFWKFTLPRGLSGVAQVAMQRLDIILVASLAGVGPAAVYAATTRFLSLGLLANGAISQAVQPLLGEALGRGDQRSARELYQTATGWLVIGAWPIYFFLIIFAPTILRVFGGGYGDGRPVLLILSVSMIVGTGCGMVSMVLTMAGKTTWNLANVLVAFGVNIGLDLLLIPHYGIVGAAVGWAVAIVTANLIPLIQVSVAFKLHPFGRGALVSMGLATVFMGLLPWCIQLRLGQGAQSLAVAAVVSGFVYAVMLWVTRRQTALVDLLSAGRRRTRSS